MVAHRNKKNLGLEILIVIMISFPDSFLNNTVFPDKSESTLQNHISRSNIIKIIETWYTFLKQ